ncbi:MAG: hypothetical protein M1339_04070 [Bacteroidetes bacterium]|nr:hypothetical protein [Bacteroidota bacterium]
MRSDFRCAPASFNSHLLEHQGGDEVAVAACEGLVDEYTTLTFYVTKVQSIITHPEEPIGVAYENSMPWWGNLYQRFTYLGDPALTLKRSAASTLVIEEDEGYHGTLVPSQSYTNPFNPTTNIELRISPPKVDLPLAEDMSRRRFTMCWVAKSRLW